jgi:hypothetical protein
MCDVITKIVIELYRKIVRWPNPKPILQNQISSLVPQHNLFLFDIHKNVNKVIFNLNITFY